MRKGSGRHFEQPDTVGPPFMLDYMAKRLGLSGCKQCIGRDRYDRLQICASLKLRDNFVCPYTRHGAKNYCSAYEER